MPAVIGQRVKPTKRPVRQILGILAASPCRLAGSSENSGKIEDFHWCGAVADGLTRGLPS